MVARTGASLYDVIIEAYYAGYRTTDEVLLFMEETGRSRPGAPVGPFLSRLILVDRLLAGATPRWKWGQTERVATLILNGHTNEDAAKLAETTYASVSEMRCLLRKLVPDRVPSSRAARKHGQRLPEGWPTDRPSKIPVGSETTRSAGYLEAVRQRRELTSEAVRLPEEDGSMEPAGLSVYETVYLAILENPDAEPAELVEAFRQLDPANKAKTETIRTGVAKVRRVLRVKSRGSDGSPGEDAIEMLLEGATAQQAFALSGASPQVINEVRAICKLIDPSLPDTRGARAAAAE